MIHLYESETNNRLGEITEEQLKFLIDHLEEESLEDKDYYFHRATLELLEAKGCDPKLLELLKKALGEKEGVEIRWSSS